MAPTIPLPEPFWKIISLKLLSLAMQNKILFRPVFYYLYGQPSFMFDGGTKFHFPPNQNSVFKIWKFGMAVTASPLLLLSVLQAFITLKHIPSPFPAMLSLLVFLKHGVLPELSRYTNTRKEQNYSPVYMHPQTATKRIYENSSPRENSSYRVFISGHCCAFSLDLPSQIKIIFSLKESSFFQVCSV